MCHVQPNWWVLFHFPAHEAYIISHRKYATHGKLVEYHVDGPVTWLYDDHRLDWDMGKTGKAWATGGLDALQRA